MRTDSCTCPVSTHDVVNSRFTFFQNGTNEFMYKVWMGTTVTPTLGKGEMGVLIVIYCVGGEGCDFLRKKVCIIRDLDSFLDRKSVV